MDSDKRLILALNCGSSSLKFGVYRVTDQAPELVCEGEAEEVGCANTSFWVQVPGHAKEAQQAVFKDHAGALAQALDLLAQQGMRTFWKAGHRVVHGGPDVREHRTLTDEVFAKLTAAVPFAPLHLPTSLAVISAMRQKMPELPQVVCLDTAFHRGMPDIARTFALPEKVRRAGIERYGFHGINLESIMAQVHPVPAKLVVAHLGNGASVTAIQQGRSIDTTMGLTPTGGVMMGTRCGDLDPGVMIFLQRHGFPGTDDLEAFVNRQSGLLGVSGLSSDVRQLMDALPKPEADLALRMFCYQVRRAIASMAAALGGLDLLVFTGGIGEHAEALRTEICKNLSWMEPFEIRVLPAQEDLQIARIAISCTQ